MRATALVIAALLAVPAMLALLRPGRGGEEAEAGHPRRTLDGLWAVVPAVLLVALTAFAVAA